MKRYLLFLFVLLTLLCGLTITFTPAAHAQTTATRISSSCINPNGTNTLQGTLGGANYTIQVPSNWNGTLVLYSHGYVFATQPLLNPAPDVATRKQAHSCCNRVMRWPVLPTARTVGRFNRLSMTRSPC